MTIEDRLRRALDEHTAEVPPPPDRWGEIEARAATEQRAVARGRSRRRAAGLAGLAAAAVVAVAFAIPAILGGGSGHRVTVVPAGPGSRTTTTPAAPSTLSPSQTSAPSAPAAPPRPAGSGYQPLWPFATLADADSWQGSYRSGGSQPWHLDAAQTAVAFSHGFLGYADIDAAFRTVLDPRGGAHVTVGFRNPNGQPVNAAVLHLVRFGSGSTAPWEVVGTDDTPDFSLGTPPYGTVAGPTLQVGGTITGVDESIKVQAFQLSSGTPVGVACCQPAGGISSLWHTTLTVHGASDRVLTIAASTGGHLAAVERFAVTAVRTRSGPSAPGL